MSWPVTTVICVCAVCGTVFLLGVMALSAYEKRTIAETRRAAGRAARRAARAGLGPHPEQVAAREAAAGGGPAAG